MIAMKTSCNFHTNTSNLTSYKLRPVATSTCNTGQCSLLLKCCGHEIIDAGGCADVNINCYRGGHHCASPRVTMLSPGKDAMSGVRPNLSPSTVYSATVEIKASERTKNFQ